MSNLSRNDVVDAFAEQALMLTSEERAELAERLLLSVAAAQPPLHPAWGPEIDRRVAELEAGVVTLIPADEVFANARRIITGSRGEA
jgi:putative addiction module component (TIGR02574 family)